MRLYFVAINQLSTARADRLPVLECRRVSRVPVFEARSWPSTVFPLCTAHDAEATIVRLALLGYHGKAAICVAGFPLVLR